MGRFFALVLVAAATAAQNPPSSLGGVWTLNKALSDMPREIGFNVGLPVSPDDPASRGGGGGGGGGGRGRRGGSGGGGSREANPFSAPRISAEDSQRLQMLTSEARNPPARLMLVDSPAAVTITNELGQSRVVHPNGKAEWIDITGVPVFTTAKRDGDRLVVTYHVEANRDVQYTYTRTETPPQLKVELQFLEHGAGDKATRVYEPGVAPSNAPAPSAPPAPGARADSPGQPAAPALPTPEKFDSRPGAELRGLKTLGVLVEDLGQQAVACGLNRDAIETAVAAKLTSGGFTVRKNTDEDTYVYINVMTTTVANGTCVSRYDAYLYAHATANLSYRDQPVLVQVSLMHRGSIGTSAPMSHASNVTRGLEGYIDVFLSQIRDANK